MPLNPPNELINQVLQPLITSSDSPLYHSLVNKGHNIARIEVFTFVTILLPKFSISIKKPPEPIMVMFQERHRSDVVISRNWHVKYVRSGMFLDDFVTGEYCRMENCQWLVSLHGKATRSWDN